MNQEKKNEMLREIENFSKKRVLVLGDAIVDEFVYGKPFGRSLDSPETKKILYERAVYFLGGAGNVAKNLLELGAEVCFFTVLGNDQFASHYLTWKNPKLKLYAFVENNRETIVKSRYADNENRLLELERLDFKDLGKDTEDKIIESVKNEIRKVDVIILQDQGHGFFSKHLIERLKDTIGKTNLKVLVNSQTYLRGPNHLDYRGFHTIFVNLDEAKALNKDFELGKNEQILNEMLESNICLTLGDKGVILLKKDKKYYSPSIPVKAVDTCGAGDSFMSAFSISNFESDPDLALKLGNIWAGLSTQKKGTETPKISELKDYIKNAKGV